MGKAEYVNVRLTKQQVRFLLNELYDIQFDNNHGRRERGRTVRRRLEEALKGEHTE